MAATTQVALPARTASPLAIWHLLSLDAPTVAALWTWFIARASNVHLPFATPAAMAIAVWILYAADRLLDTRHLGPHTPVTCPLAIAQPAYLEQTLEARHFFHRHHRRAFLTGIALAAMALAALLPGLNSAAIRLFLVEGALLLAWFLVLHAPPCARRLHPRRLPKEIAVGLFFAAATFTPTIARAPGRYAAFLPAAILFAALCSLNCLFICSWEHDALYPGLRPPDGSAPPRLPTLAFVIAIAGAALALFAASWPVPVACALAALLLLILHCNRRRVSRIHLRAAVDLALLTPILLLPFLLLR